MLRDELIIGRDLPPTDRQRLSREAKAGAIRRLARGFYTGNMELPLEEVVRRNALNLAAIIQPGGVLTARSGFELLPTKSVAGLHLFVAGGSIGRSDLPGFTVHRTGGCGPLTGDMPYLGLYRPSFARRCLENLTPSRLRPSGAGIARTLGRVKVGKLVLAYCAQQGSTRLMEQRDLARDLAPLLGLDTTFQELDLMIFSAVKQASADLVKVSGALR